MNRYHLSKMLSPLKTVSLGLVVFISMMAHSQTYIKLTPDEQERQGIEVIQVKAVDNTTGIEVAAEVISSPFSASHLVALYDGVVQRWLLNAGASIKLGDRLVEIQSKEILALQREWKQAETNMEQAKFDLEKDKLLFAEGVISARRFAETQRGFSNAMFAFESLTQALKLAGLNMQSSSLEQGVYIITAPIDGMLSHHALQAGEAVKAGELVGEITIAGAPWIKASIPIQQARELELGQTLRLSESNSTVIIKQQDKTIDPSTQTLDIYAQFSSERDVYSGEILKLILPSATQGVWVPGGAVVHNGSETTVYRRTTNGFEALTVNLVPSGTGYIANSDIQAGDEIVVQGAAILKGIDLGLGGGE